LIFAILYNKFCQLWGVL